MRFFLSLFVLFFLSSCALFKSKKEYVTVQGKIEIHKPYCGGAKPTPEMNKGTTEPYANATFYVKTQMNNDKKSETVLKFKTKADGSYKFKIKKGVYVVVHEDKVMGFEAFVAKYKPSSDKFLEYIGDAEAKNQYELLDFTIDAQKSGEVSYAYKSKCFSGMNPLHRYIGPKPE